MMNKQRKMLKTSTSFVLVLCMMLSGLASLSYAAGETMLDYSKRPAFLTTDVKPNIVVALDISGSMKAVAYRDTSAGNWKTGLHADFNPSEDYYGYFEGFGANYSYDALNGFFFRDDVSGQWSGNFLNWLTMRRIDVARKVLVGGKVRDRSGETLTAGNDIAPDTWYVLLGQHEPSDYEFQKVEDAADTSSSAYTPYNEDQQYLISEGKFEALTSGAATNTKVSTEVEVGMVTMSWANGDTWTEVEFSNTYTNPIVVAKPISYNGGNETGVRIKDIGDATIGSNGGFRVRLQEWDYLDGNHTTEDIMYIVAEQGHHTVALDGGGSIEFDATTFSTSATGMASFVSRTFDTSFPVGTTPVLFTGVGSFNDSSMVITRNQNVSNAGFDVVMQEEEANDQFHSAEDIYAIAISKASGVTSVTRAIIETADTGVIVDEVWETITFSSSFSSSPLVVLDIQTTIGDNPVNMRFRKRKAASIQVKLEEEKSGDSENEHVDENVGYLAVTGSLSYNIKVGAKVEPKGILQGMSSRVRFGLSVYNYSHTKEPTEIYNGNTVDGGTFKPCYPDVSKAVGERTNFDICLETHVKSPMDNIVRVVEEYPLVWGTTPIAETLYDIYGYASQIDHSVAGGVNGSVDGEIQFKNNGTFACKDSTTGKQLWGSAYDTSTECTNAGHSWNNMGCFGADNQYTSAGCTSAGGIWDVADSYEVNDDWDPYYYDEAALGAGDTIECPKTFVLHLNDGAPYKDWEGSNNPNILCGNGSAANCDYDSDSNPGATHDGTGSKTEILDDLSLFLRDNDLRSDLDDWQEIITYYVYAALGENEDTNQTRKIREAAANGGFVDDDDSHDPDVSHPSNFTTYISSGTCTANEWDEDADCSPDTFYFANNGYQLVAELTQAFADMLKRLASGTAASVISSSRSGEGAIYQAVFYPSHIDSGLREINWAGDVHALWVDRYGNIREDCGDPTDTVNCSDPCAAACPLDMTLNLEADYIIKFYTDPATGAAKAKRYHDADGDGAYDEVSDFVAENINLQSLRYIWSAGNWLAGANSGQKANYDDIPTNLTAGRYIFSNDPSTDEIIPFTTSDLPTALTANGYKGYLKAVDATEADKIVNYIRGKDQTGYRSRLIDWDGNGTTETYKLGDIVNSTPTVVSAPAEDYDVIYGDSSYRQFRKKYEKRRTVIYAGGNDGGLHAFNGGYYDRTNKHFLKAPPIVGTDPVQYETQYDLGTEMWMYIPSSLLPHLKWLTDTSYTIDNHIYYVDLKPKVFDAKIFDPNDGIHTGGWGTILVGGMRYGGGNIGVDTNGDGTDDDTMRSSYFILDITNPECAPVLLAEYSSADLGFTTGFPSAIPMLKCDIRETNPAASDYCGSGWPMNWYLAFGSGPHDASNAQTAMEGRSDQKAKLYIFQLGGTDGSDPAVLDYVYTTTPQATPSGSCPSLITYNRPSLVAGYPIDISPICSDPAITDDAPGTGCTANGNTWEEFPKSFLGDIISVDYDLSYQVDSLYFGSITRTNLALNSHAGGMHRLAIHDIDTPASWSISTFLNTGQPSIAAPAAAYDGQDYWLYFGSGRFFTTADKGTNSQQSFYGVKEQDIIGTFNLSAPSDGNLVDVSSLWVEDGLGTLSSSLHDTTGGKLTLSGSQRTPITTFSAASFKDLKNAMVSYDGWKIDFDLSGERNLGQAAILGDIVTFTTYVPSSDFCSAEGESYLWAPYYRTGTAYYRSVIGVVYEPISGKDKVRRKISLGSGLSTTPNLFSGMGDGTKAFVQTSTGAIIDIEQKNPGIYKSGPASWRELMGD